MIQRVWYQWTKFYTSIVLQFYFKKLQVIHADRIPKDTPIIFAVNHQNAFLDAVIVACSSHRNPFFLTRAGVFQNKVARFLLNSLQMIPIYRFRDGLKNVKKNDLIIKKCVGLLKASEAVLIFPEGNHDLKWRLRPLQKGICRIAFEAEKASNFRLGVAIVPVGLQYSDATRFRSNVLVNFGEPIQVNDFVSYYQSEPLLGINKLKREISQQLQKLIIDIQPLEEYEKKLKHFQFLRRKHYDLKKQLESDQHLIKTIGEKQEELASQSPVKAQNWETVLLFPVYIYGFTNNILIYLFMRGVIRKWVKDPHFLGSIKFALGMSLIPIFYILQMSLFFVITQSIWWLVLYAFSLPLSGVLAFDYFKLNMLYKNL